MKTWVLGLLLIVAVWVAWFLLRPPESMPKIDLHAIPMWIPVVISAALLLIIVWSAVGGRARAALRAKALALRASRKRDAQPRPGAEEREAKIQAMRRHVLEGITTLERSELGKRSRKSALYSLPWYLFIGPEGAGKTMALLNSGLPFPYHDPGALAGARATESCEVQLTNEGVVLDTAGRYLMEDESHEEWLALLQLLGDYHGAAPLHGVVVAVGIDSLFRADDSEIDRLGQAIHARIDEVAASLEVALPVYLLFTKCDLVAGFAESFADLTDTERARPWGATLPYSGESGAEPARFEQEFRTLIASLYAHTLKRLTAARDQGTAARVFQFPLELAALEDRLTRFVAAAFAPRTGRDKATEPPTFRGAYFASAAQEGAPFEHDGPLTPGDKRRRALRTAGEPRSETKSYFLRDIFSAIIFPDRVLARRTEAARRRERKRGALAATAAWVVGLGLVLFGSASFSNNRRLAADTAAAAIRVDWADPPRALSDLETIRAPLATLHTYWKDGPPFFYRGLYAGDKLRKPLVARYMDGVVGITRPAAHWLELRVATTSGEESCYAKDFELLKVYLLLGDPERLRGEIRWETERLTSVWADALRAQYPALRGDALEAAVRPHAALYVDLLAHEAIPALPLDDALVRGARAELARVGAKARYYDRLVKVAGERKKDEAGPDTPDNRLYPPISIARMFADRARVIAVLKSNTAVDGAYTAPAMGDVLASIEKGAAAILADQWVAPLPGGDRAINDARDELRQEYQKRYVESWEAFFRGITVNIPLSGVGPALEVLSGADMPYEVVVRALAENTQPPDGGGRSTSAPPTGISAPFRAMVGFASPAQGSGLADYGQIVAKLASELARTNDPVERSGLADRAWSDVNALKTRKLDSRGRDLMGGLLLAPIERAMQSVKAKTREEAVARWRDSVRPSVIALSAAYPFRADARDADLRVFRDFFRPGGVLAGVYEAWLRPFVVERSGVFSPTDASSELDPRLYDCLSRGDRIRRALFDGDAGPRLRLSIRVRSADLGDIGEDRSAGAKVIVRLEGSEAELEPDGSSRAHDFDWTADPSGSAEIAIAPAGFLPITTQGAFSLFRLVAAGQVQAVEKDRIVVAIRMIARSSVPRPIRDPSAPAPPRPPLVEAVVVLEISARGSNPFDRDLFNGLGCPLSIGAAASADGS